MNKVTVYRFKLYDIQNDCMVESQRWGTEDAIIEICGISDEHTAISMDEKFLTYDPGFTDKGFLPKY